MRVILKVTVSLVFHSLLLLTGVANAELRQYSPENVYNLWDGEAPGTPASWTEPEFRGQNSISNVTRPTLTVVRPQPEKANGTAMIVAPGGAFTGLAWNLEGAEVADWLAGLGVTAFILKYRVHRGPEPTSADGVSRIGVDLAAADGLQAMAFVRKNAEKFGVNPDRIGFMGFSAGAMTTMNVVLRGDEATSPNFIAPIYGGMPPVPAPKNGPPAFIVVAQDDEIMLQRSIDIFTAWNSAGLPAELHVYEKGGHGFGTRRRDLPVGSWTSAFEAWAIDHGYLSVPR